MIAEILYRQFYAQTHQEKQRLCDLREKNRIVQKIRVRVIGRVMG